MISAADRLGRRTVEVSVGGWRYEFEVEAEAKATLRERGTRSRRGVGQSGDHLEVRAIMPGRIISIAVGAGEKVEVGQTLLVVEAMKMQNDLRAPRAGIVHSVAVAAGSTVELGDILAILR
ncbi:MAG: acetyl-CoA carboxylase biotin carboxyl carrier protein subunit [Candidatus Limnocylindrales bacterium]